MEYDDDEDGRSTELELAKAERPKGTERDRGTENGDYSNQKSVTYAYTHKL